MAIHDAVIAVDFVDRISSRCPVKAYRPLPPCTARCSVRVLEYVVRDDRIPLYVAVSRHYVHIVAF